MNRIAKSILALALITTLAGCRDKPAGHDQPVRSVNEQHLATYTPLRRLTYRDTCRNAEALTICVKRISLAETAAVVELSINNRSAAPYRPEKRGAPSLVLATSGGSFLQGSMEGLPSIPPGGEKYLYCRLEGRLGGDLKAVVLEGAPSPGKIIDIMLPSI